MSRILCVEDDPEFQRLISQVLRNQGYEVHYAFTGPEGRDKSISLNPDLILMDIMLPGMSGVQVVRFLRKNPSTRATPVIVMTALPSGPGSIEEEVRAMKNVEYLRKPVRAADLLPLMRRLLADSAAKPPAECWVHGGVRIFPNTKSVLLGERVISRLGPKRFMLLVELARAEEVPWDELVRNIWGIGGRKNDLEKAIERLRRDFGDQAYRIATTRRGYRLLA